MTDKLIAAAEHFIVAWDSLTTVDLALAEPFVEALRQALEELEELEELPPVKSYCGGKPNYCETDDKEIYHLWRESESYQVPMTDEGERLAQHRYRGFKKGYMARREWVGLSYEDVVKAKELARGDNPEYAVAFVAFRLKEYNT